MHVTLYLAIMLTLSTIIAALLLLMVLERRPQDRHTAVRQPAELNQLSPDRRGRNRTRLAVQRAIRNRRREGRRRRLDARRRTIILGGLSLDDDNAEDERNQDREAFQGWEPPAPTAAPGLSPSATANGQTHG